MSHVMHKFWPQCSQPLVWTTSMSEKLSLLLDKRLADQLSAGLCQCLHGKDGRVHVIHWQQQGMTAAKAMPDGRQ